MSISQPQGKDVMEHRTLKLTDSIKKLEEKAPEQVNAPPWTAYGNRTPMQIDIGVLDARVLGDLEQAVEGKGWSAQGYLDRKRVAFMTEGNLQKSIRGEAVMMDNTTANLNVVVPPPKPPGWVSRHLPGAARKKQEAAPQ